MRVCVSWSTSLVDDTTSPVMFGSLGVANNYPPPNGHWCEAKPRVFHDLASVIMLLPIRILFDAQLTRIDSERPRAPPTDMN